jgi:hypothetical protein
MFLTDSIILENKMTDIVKLSQDKFIRIISEKIESTEKMKLLWRCSFIVLIFFMCEWLIIKSVMDNSVIVSLITLLVALKFVYLNYESYNSSIFNKNNRIGGQLKLLEDLFDNEYIYTAQDNGGVINTVLVGQKNNVNIKYVNSENTMTIQYPAYTDNLSYMIGYNISKKEFNSIIEKKLN